jgi:hypothetical protein
MSFSQLFIFFFLFRARDSEIFFSRSKALVCGGICEFELQTEEYTL